MRYLVSGLKCKLVINTKNKDGLFLCIVSLVSTMKLGLLVVAVLVAFELDMAYAAQFSEYSMPRK